MIGDVVYMLRINGCGLVDGRNWEDEDEDESSVLYPVVYQSAYQSDLMTSLVGVFYTLFMNFMNYVYLFKLHLVRASDSTLEDQESHVVS